MPRKLNPEEWDKASDYYADDPYGEKPGADTRDARRFGPQGGYHSEDFYETRPQRPYRDYQGMHTESHGSYNQRDSPLPRSEPSAPEDHSTGKPSVEELWANTVQEERWATFGNRLLNLPPPSKTLRPLSQRTKPEADGTMSVRLSQRADCYTLPIYIPAISTNEKQLPETKIDYYFTPEQLYNPYLSAKEDEQFFLGNLTIMPVLHKMHERLREDAKLTISREVMRQARQKRNNKLAKHQSSPSYPPSQPARNYSRQPRRSQAYDSRNSYVPYPPGMSHTAGYGASTPRSHGKRPPQQGYYESPDGTTTVSWSVSSGSTPSRRIFSVYLG